MINWELINNKSFENLAFEYMSDKYPKLKWVPTKETRDGNRDGETKQVAALDVTLKYWYEAKYSKSFDKSISKSHLDSTLVSCMLEKNVVWLAFITNAYISDDYRRRADVFSKQRDNLKIIYINGDEIENWLFENPDIENKYFCSNNTAKQYTFKDNVQGACILQNYDFSGNQFTKVKKIECEKEYILYFSFYSSCEQIVSIFSNNSSLRFLSIENSMYDKYYELKAHIGYNSFYLPIEVLSTATDQFDFEIKTIWGVIKFSVNDVSIIKIYNPQIIYSSQRNIQNQIYTMMNDRDETNSLFHIIGDAGSGKSYLIHNIYHDTGNPFSSYVIRFTGNDKIDLVNCFKIIIASLYGDIWEYINDDYNVKQFNDVETYMLHEIKCQTTKDIPEHIFNYFKSIAIKDEIDRPRRQIFIDDFHKLSIENASLLNMFCDWFIQQHFNCRIFIFMRPTELSGDNYTKKFKITNIEPQDIRASIMCNFKNQHNLNQLIGKYPLPLNVLHFINLLCKIHDVEYEFSKKSDLEIQIILNSIYYDSNQTSCLAFGNQIVGRYKYNRIVYCVYKIKFGVPVDAIVECFGEESYNEICELITKRIILENANMLYPFHDIFAAAYESINSPKMNDVLESFVVSSAQNGYISKATKFTCLLNIGHRCFWRYRKDASEYRDELHENADYFHALEIAKSIKESTFKNLDKYDFSDCKNLFVLANCTKYTMSYSEANLIFADICSVYESTNNAEILGIYLESETEIVNNLIWMLDVKVAKQKLDKLAKKFDKLYSSNRIIGHNMTYALLNYYNRIMFVKYMLDEGSEKDYQKAINISREFNKPEYVAFAKMDYAKSIYDKDIMFATSLMKDALTLLGDCNEKRRYLDALSEVRFLDDLRNGTFSYSDYLEIKNEMKSNHYIQSEVKIQLKIIALSLLLGELPPEEIRNQLSFIVVNNSAISAGKRHQAYIYHLYAASYYVENNILMCKKYSRMSLNLMKNMGQSYQTVHQNNLKLNNYQGIVLLNEEHKSKFTDKFILDFRLW